MRSMLGVVHKLPNEILTMYTECRHLRRDSLYSVLAAESEMVDDLDKLLTRGVNKGSFKIKDPFITANIIQYLIVMESFWGWNFKNRYTFSRFTELFIDFI